MVRKSLAGLTAATMVAVILVAFPAAAEADGFQRSPQPFDSTPVEPVSGAGSAFEDAAPNWSGGPADPVGASGSGDWTATDLSHAGSWTHGGASGAFTYTYGMRTPPAAGPTPALSLSYSSASHDGRTSGTNNQASWIGDGWSYSPGFVERTYAACSSESEQDGNQGDDLTGDLCWKDDSPAITLSLNGVNSSLVRDDDTGQWRTESDANWRIRRVGSVASPGSASTERWVVTTTDGTRHYFASSSSSRLTVPVFGNHSGEPCYKSGDFEGSRCHQAYRWLLDKSVDVHGNLIRYTYSKATGRYGPAMSEDATASYDREAWLRRIEYGLRDGSSTGATAKIEFTTADRCLADCRTTGGGPKEDNWPDTPWDLHCESSTDCETHSPVFFFSKRLAEVATYVANGSGFRKVDSWQLTHEFKDYGDEEQVVLWLASVHHTGHVGGTVTMPPVKLGGTFYENRVDAGEAWPGIWRPRLTSIKNETGGVTTINYSEPDCGSGDVPSSHHQNNRRCYPAKYTPDGLADPVDAYFHKYLVRSIAESDATGGGDTVWTFYDYSTAGGGTSALWAWNDAELVDDDDRDWNQWRGYAQVTTRVGDPADPGPQARSRTRYFRGLDGDKLPSGTRSVTVTDSQGNTATDHRSLSGMTWENASYDNTTIIASSTTWYWHSRTAVRTHDGGKLEAFMTGAKRTDSRTRLSSSSWRQTRVDNTYDAYGRVVAVDDRGDLSVSGDERCLRTTYTDNTTAWLFSSVAAVEAVSVRCSATPSRPADLMGAARAYYDGNTSHTAAPTRGLMTRAEAVAEWNGGPVYAMIGESSYDPLGRPLTSTDALGNTSATSYTPAGAGPVTQTTVTNAAGHLTTSYLQPAWGSITRTIAPNARSTTVEYDPMGRATAVWTPGRNPATHPASKLFSYDVSQTEPTTVTTKTMLHDESYLTEIVLYDSLLRDRQVQTQTSGGRLISQTVYDSYGRVRFESDPVFNNQSGPTDSLVWITRPNDVSRTEYVYDNAGRVTDEKFVVKDEERWRTRYRYGGHDDYWMTTTIAPEGGMSTATLADAKGHTVELRQYHNRAAPGAFDATTYGYNADGELEQVTDPVGNTWSFEYDLRGRPIALHDPDTGTNTRTYNVGGQVASTIDGNGTLLSYVYDELGRPTQLWDGAVDAGELLIERVYDGATRGIGHPYTATHWVDGQAWTTQIRKYSTDGQPQQVFTHLPEAAGALAGAYWESYTYYPDGSLLSSRAIAAGGLASETMVYHRNSMGQAHRVTSNGDDFGEGHVYVDEAIYSPYGQLLQRRLGDPDDVGGTSGQAWQTWIYEEGTGRLTDFYFDKDTAGEYDGTNYGIAALSYEYDDAGNMLSITDDPVHTSGHLDPETQCFQYDYLRRLTEAWAQAGTGACAATPGSGVVGGPGAYWSSYEYDLTGNRVAEAKWRPTGIAEYQYSYGAAGQDRPHAVTSVSTTADGGSTTAFSYDAAGYTTAIDRGGEVDTLAWTPAGRVDTIENGDGETRFFDDADGSRILRIDPNGDMTAWVAGYELNYTAVTDTVRATRYYKHRGGVVGVRANLGDIQWLGSDHHGTNQWIVNGDTLTAKVRRFDPFGNQRSASSSIWPDQRGFVGGIENAGVGLTTVGAREYDAATGRFISVDPVALYGNPQQLNGYAYASNNPVGKSDASGLRETECSPGGGGCDNNGFASKPDDDGGGGGGGDDSGATTNCAAGGYGCTDSNGNDQGSCGATGTCDNSQYNPSLNDAMLMMNCLYAPPGGQCESTQSQYVTLADQGIIVIDLFIAAEWFMPGFMGGHGNNRGHSTEPYAESKVKVLWDTATGQVTTVIWPTCVGDTCYDAVELCYGCDDPHSVDNSVSMNGVPRPMGPPRPWHTDTRQGAMFRVEAVNSFLPAGPSINRDITVAFDGPSSHVSDSGNSFPSLTVVQYTRDGQTNVLAEMDESNANLGLFWLGLSSQHSIWEDGQRR